MGASLTVYRLMADKQLAIAISDLEHRLEQMQFARGPVAGKLTDAYADASEP